MTHIQTINCLDLKQIADSGQCFRMLPSPAGGYTIARFPGGEPDKL